MVASNKGGQRAFRGGRKKESNVEAVLGGETLQSTTKHDYKSLVFNQTHKRFGTRTLYDKRFPKFCGVCLKDVNTLHRRSKTFHVHTLLGDIRLAHGLPKSARRTRSNSIAVVGIGAKRNKLPDSILEQGQSRLRFLTS